MKVFGKNNYSSVNFHNEFEYNNRDGKREFLMTDVTLFFKEKEICIKDLNNHKLVREFYKKIRKLSLNELEELFPAPVEIIAQNIFDYTNEILSEPGINTALNISLSMFSIENINRCKDESLFNDLRLLQALFFFLIEEICDVEKTKYSNLFNSAITEGSWNSPKKQAYILNEISSKMSFNIKNPFSTLDFTELGSRHFKVNESILRLFFNFTHPALYVKEGIVNELNFIREQQKNILPVFPNTKKTNYKSSAANKEIKLKSENLKILRSLDYGFKDDAYIQSFFAGTEDLKNSFQRPIECKCFQETELQWEHEPYFDKRSWRRKIIARKSDRAANKTALRNKFLYSERNMLTHVSENFAVFKLFSREYNNDEKKFWEELILDSICDVHDYLLSMEAKNVQEKLMRILNHYFKKITDALGMIQPVEERWNLLFDENGELNLEPDDLRKTNIFNILSDDELTHFKRFMSFMYCSENDDNDFFERNQLRIQLYLICLSLNLSKLDK